MFFSRFHSKLFLAFESQNLVSEMPWRVLINSIIIKCGAAHSSRLLRKRRERLEWLRQTRCSSSSSTRAGRRRYLPASRWKLLRQQWTARRWWKCFVLLVRWWSWKKMFLRPEFVTWNFSHSPIDCILYERSKKRLRRCPNRLPIVVRLQEEAFFLRFVNGSHPNPILPTPPSRSTQKKGDAKSITKISHSNRWKVAR